MTISAGTILPYGGSSAPTDFLLCDGSAVSRSTYSVLFGVIGTSFGAGNGSTTFNIPDLRGRVAAGKDNMGGSAASRLTSTTMSPNGTTLGAAGGEETHTLITSEIPSHTHDVTSLYKGHVAQFGGAGHYDAIVEDTIIATSFTTDATGGDGAHNNVQPTLIVNYIIATQDVSGTGTVTSVTFTGDGTVLSNTPSSAVTTSGTLSATLNTQAKNTVLAGPASGSNAAPTFRALVSADLPNTPQAIMLTIASLRG